MPHELDSVELAVSVNGWPAGTPGTVVDVPAEGFVTVEITNERIPSDTPLLDALIDLPASAVTVTERPREYA